jgi:hypothetical protein
MQCTKGAKMIINQGNIGVITLDDVPRLYRVNHCLNGLVYVQSIEGALSFRIVLPDHFWVLIDQF